MEAWDLADDQRFVVQRCVGEPCDAAEHTFSFIGRGVEVMKRSFQLETAGRYLFYAQRLASGAVGPLRVLDVKNQAGGFEAWFEGDLAVRVSFRAATRPLPGEAPTEVKEDAVEILHVSPEILTRGVPTEVTVDIRVHLDSHFSGTAMVGFNTSVSDVRTISEAASRPVSAGSQDLTLVVDVVPVDWGDRGNFEVGVYLLPPTEHPSALRPVATARQALEVVP